MSGCAILVAIPAVGIMAQELHKTRAKMQSLPYSTKNEKYQTKGKRLVEVNTK